MQLPDLKVFHLSRVGAAPGQAVFACDELLGEQVDVVDAKAVSDFLDKAGSEINSLAGTLTQLRARSLHAQVRDLERNYALLLEVVKIGASDQPVFVEFVQDWMCGWDIGLRGLPSKVEVLRFALLSILGSEAIKL